MATPADTDIREIVREKYASAARAAAAGEPCGCGGASDAESSCCGPSDVALTDRSGVQVFGDSLLRTTRSVRR
jgi:hypothetical protein